MKNRFMLTVILIAVSFCGFSQQIPVGSCGIVHVYDASGNRIKRTYFCNNGSNPYPARIQNQQTMDTKLLYDSLSSHLTLLKPQSIEFQVIDALYPNPSTGKFFITFSQPLHNAIIFITDANGKTILQFKSSGNKVNFDLSSVPAGVYFIKVNDSGNILTKKVVKQ
jgi:hypothetical protein